MGISNKQILKAANYLIFITVFFLQSFGDGYYIAHGQDPVMLKLVKYSILALGVAFGSLQILHKKNTVFRKETASIMLAICSFLFISLILMMFRNGNLGLCIELIIRFSMSILYAYVLLNIFEFKGIYNLMTVVLIFSLLGWFLEKGSDVFTLQNIKYISFSRSSSPFESSYFAAPSVNCCAFFLYYKKNKIITILSFVFVLLTFKRPAIVFSVLFLVCPLLFDVNKVINKWIYRLWQSSFVLGTLLYYWLLLPENEWMIQKVTGQSASLFTQGRSNILRAVLYSGYQSQGLGSTNLVAGRGIEMDLIAFLLEMTVIGLIIFVFCYSSVSGRRRYSVLVMTFQLLTCLTGSGLYNAFGWVCAFLFFGCIEYKHLETKDNRIFKKYRMGRTTTYD